MYLCNPMDHCQSLSFIVCKIKVFQQYDVPYFKIVKQCSIAVFVQEEKGKGVPGMLVVEVGGGGGIIIIMLLNNK
jgi:hypothetical protein